MRIRCAYGLILLLAAAVHPGCGGGGGGGGAGAAFDLTVTASRAVALADGADVVAIQADVRTPDGAVAPDGTSVAFAVTYNSGSLSAPAATTANGRASVSLTHAPIQGANSQMVMVTASAGSASGTGGVKFINQPARAEVFVAFDQAVTNLAALQFRLNNTAGAVFDNAAQAVTAVNAAAGALVAARFDAAVNSCTIALADSAGFNTGTTPIIKITYAVVPGAGLPVFSIDPTAAGSLAADTAGGATVPPVTAADLVVSAAFDTEQ